MNTDQEAQRGVAVIGAGPSGLAAMRNLKAAGVDFVGYESHADIGGIWDRSNPKSSVYRNTHTITSKGITAFSDFPMPDGFPVYPGHSQVLSYLNGYADHFGLRSHIRFGDAVESLTRAANGGWVIRSSNGAQAWFQEVIIANGHNWYPRMPDFPGEFEGKMLHACEYTDAREFADKRVLVIGAGNSGCDIAVECCQIASRLALSMRRGYNFYPKFIAGYPADQVGMKVRSLGLPGKWASRIMGWLLRLSAGDQQRMGLPKPDHRPLQTPAIVNSLVPYYAAHGRINITPGVERFERNVVHFTNGSSQEFDVIILATGYEIHMPFATRADLDWKGNKPDFYLYAFSKRFNDLFIAGMTDSTGGHFPTVELQSRVIAQYIAAKRKYPDKALQFESLIRKDKVDLNNGIDFIDVPRNATQFSLLAFRRALNDHLNVLAGI
jgi:hypothetical protein